MLRLKCSSEQPHAVSSLAGPVKQYLTLLLRDCLNWHQDTRSGNLFQSKTADLLGKKSGVGLAAAQQLRVRADFRNPAIVKNDDQVGVDSAAQAMRDQENRSPFH
jgi:hypothetical protein